MAAVASLIFNSLLCLEQRPSRRFNPYPGHPWERLPAAHNYSTNSLYILLSEALSFETAGENWKYILTKYFEKCMVCDQSCFLVSHTRECQTISTSFVVNVIHLSVLVGGLPPRNIVQFCSIFVQMRVTVGGSYNSAHVLNIRLIVILCLFTP